MDIFLVNINTIKPYWRNPRRNDKAIEAVKKSIKEYGFNQPLVLDKNNVIIVGHARYKALRELGIEEIPCVVLDIDEDRAKQYRIADNKTSELSEWDNDMLMFELREIEEIKDMSEFFKVGEIERLLDMKEFNAAFEKDRELRTKIANTVTAQVMKVAPPDEKPEVLEQIIQARIEQEYDKEIQKRIDNENERIQRTADALEVQFEKKSQEREEDYIGVECPYCNEKYFLSKSEVLRSKKLQ